MILFGQLQVLKQLSTAPVREQAQRARVASMRYTAEEQAQFIRCAQGVFNQFPTTLFISVYKTVDMFYFSAEMPGPRTVTRRYERVQHPYGLSIPEVVTGRLWEEWDTSPQRQVRVGHQTILDSGHWT